MRRLAFAVPGDLATPTGGYAYDRRVIADLRQLGWSIDLIDLGEGFPHPSPAQVAAAGAALTAVPAGVPIVVDGLALGVLPHVAAAISRQLIALVHHPLALESGLSANQQAAFVSSERAALAVARRVIVTSVPTADMLARDYAVARDRITVAPPGTDRIVAAERAGHHPPRLVAVGAIVPRKGYDTLIEALATLAALPWRLTIVGAPRDALCTHDLERAIATSALTDRITLAGAVDDAALDALYRDADIFVQASRFEGYGMAVAEAIAHGLPVIATATGAAPAIVPDSAGMLVPPGDARALAEALRRLLADHAMVMRLAAGARRAAAALPTWRACGQAFIAAVTLPE